MQRREFIGILVTGAIGLATTSTLSPPILSIVEDEITSAAFPNVVDVILGFTDGTEYIFKEIPTQDGSYQLPGLTMHATRSLVLQSIHVWHSSLGTWPSGKLKSFPVDILSGQSLMAGDSLRLLVGCTYANA